VPGGRSGYRQRVRPLRTLVTGATGYVGSRLVTALLDAGHDVVVAGRDPRRLGRFGWFDDVQSVRLDVHDAASVRAALAEAGALDVLYYLVHGIGEAGYREADNAAAADVAAAARDAGVRRIVYLGGFVPAADGLSEHLNGRAEVADALNIADGPELVWLGAAMIIGAGSTSFEMLRYVADRFPVIPTPAWSANPMDPISIRDVLHFLVSAADAERVPPGAYDIHGPQTTTYGELLQRYCRIAHRRRPQLPVRGVDIGVVSRCSAALLPIPAGLTADLVASLDFPMTAAEPRLGDLVDPPPGGPIGIDEAIARSLSPAPPRPVDDLADPHHLADTDPDWAGGDTLRIRRLAAAVTPAAVHPALGLLDAVPGPVAGAVRTGLDTLLGLVPGIMRA